MNIPLARGAGEFEYLSSFPSIQREMEKFQPEFVLVSAGFDAHKQDPLGGMNLPTSSFEIFTREIQNIANTYADGKMISFLEGGYDFKALAESVKLHLETLAS